MAGKDNTGVTTIVAILAIVVLIAFLIYYFFGPRTQVETRTGTVIIPQQKEIVVPQPPTQKTTPTTEPQTPKPQ
jgi:hypothetical protein